MAKTPKKEKRRIEQRGVLKAIRRILEVAPQGDDLDETEFDDIHAYIKLLRWQKESQGAALFELLVQIVDAYTSSRAAFHPSSVLALVKVLEERFELDIDVSKKQPD